jgi:hypothetical protein
MRRDRREHLVRADVADLPAGIYFYQLKTSFTKLKNLLLPDKPYEKTFTVVLLLLSVTFA